jgi:hypothetical protein
MGAEVFWHHGTSALRYHGAPEYVTLVPERPSAQVTKGSTSRTLDARMCISPIIVDN